ncbi:MAG TPA: ATP-dependent DNA ligase, partial [Trebonia sp.]
MPAADKFAVQVDGRDLTLTNLAKVLYPADGFTKAEVLDYYQRISPVLLPHVAGRPMTLKRYPDGVAGESFFAKHAPAGRPDWVRTEEIVSGSPRSRAPGEPIEYVVLDDLPTLMWAANLAALELHVPMWRFPSREGGHGVAPAPEHGLEPDLLVFDLDPGAPATVVDCCRVAEALRPVLADADLDALPKTSGGKGLQLYASI